MKAHPRGCGEKKLPTPQDGSRMGSPPRVRGKADFNFSVVCHGGITPAGAGKSSTNAVPSQYTRDHPRGCGEKAALCTVVRMSIGSPPRVRGKDPQIGVEAKAERITPAGAGKSFDVKFNCKPHRDHPRGCGEKAAHAGRHNDQNGSPPRVRGKASSLRPLRFRSRITPAGAGKSHK